MICPNCKSRKTEYLETRKKAKVESNRLIIVDVDYNYCWECDFLWKIENGNFIGGAVVQGGEQDFPTFDNMEIEIVKSLNLRNLDFKCNFCGSTVIVSLDGKKFECTMCGAVWEAIIE